MPLTATADPGHHHFATDVVYSAKFDRDHFELDGRTVLVRATDLV
jgi:hypothetical protein